MSTVPADALLRRFLVRETYDLHRALDETCVFSYVQIKDVCKIDF